MFSSHIKPILRSLFGHKGYAAINIIGLSVGLACSLIIMLFVMDELSFDACHKKADRIYRVLTFNEGFEARTPETSFLLAPTLKDNFPEIEYTARIRFVSCRIKNNEGWQRGRRFYAADPEIFNIFTIPLVRGNQDQALAARFSVILSENMVQRHFPDSDPIGQNLLINCRGEEINLTVTGVMENLPRKSSFKADFISSLNIGQIYLQRLFKSYNLSLDDSWDQKHYRTYLLLSENAKADILSKDIPIRLKQYNEKAETDAQILQALPDFYLNSSHIVNHHMASGNLQNIYIFSAVAFLILILAGANYGILSMARSLIRTKEYGVRKIIGASSAMIVRQIIGESLLTTISALPIAIVLIEIFLPFVNRLFVTQLESNFYSNWSFWIGTLLIIIFIGVASSIYQAFVISKFNPIAIFNKNAMLGSGKSIFRRIIVTAQLVIFVSLTASSLVIYKQIDHSISGEVGFDRQNVLATSISRDIRGKYETIKNELGNIPGVIGVSGTSILPPNDGYAIMPFPTALDSTVTKTVEGISIDYDFFSTLGLTILEGRDFSPDMDAPGTNSVILNETAVKELGVENPVGKILGGYKIIGVVKDFHQHSFRMEIKPMVFDLNPQYISDILVRVNPENATETVAAINKSWSELYSSASSDFHYLAEYFESTYHEERNFSQIILYFTLLAIGIASLGLLGLSSFMGERRSKEIGIRKVFGASIPNIVVLLIKEFVLLVILASIISWPIIHYVMSHWLENFVYRIDIGVQPVLIGLVLGLIITCIAAGYHSLKAALSNPVDAIKYE
ncbi:MAG: ABC transporter permease [candidate division Zixibacteria bacterium]